MEKKDMKKDLSRANAAFWHRACFMTKVVSWAIMMYNNNVFFIGIFLAKYKIATGQVAIPDFEIYC